MRLSPWERVSARIASRSRLATASLFYSDLCVTAWNVRRRKPPRGLCPVSPRSSTGYGPRSEPRFEADGRCSHSGAEGPSCLLYTSDAADDLLCVDLGGRR